MNQYLIQQGGILYETHWREPHDPAWTSLSVEQQARWGQFFEDSAKYFQKQQNEQGSNWWDD